MLDRKLNPVTRGSYIAMAIITGLEVAIFAYLSLVGVKSFPPAARGIFGCAGAFALIGLILAIRTLWRGRVNVRSEGNTLAWFVWGGVLLVFMGIVLTAPYAANSTKALVALTSAVGFLIVGLSLLLGNAVSQSTLQVREELLKLELQIARLAERMDGTPSDDADLKSRR